MVCYVINFILWLIGVSICSVIIGNAFEIKNKNIKRWKSIVGLILVQMPFMMMKYLFNHNDIIRNAGWVLTAVVCVVYLIVFYEGYLWQKILFIVFEAISACTSEMIVQILLQDELTKLESASFYEPFMIIYQIYCYMIMSLMFLLFFFVWKQFVKKESYNLKIYFVFSIFPVSQIVMMTSVNSKLYEEMTLAGIVNILGLVISIMADVILLVTLLRQQSMQEMTIRLAAMEKTWEVEKNHYRDIEARREELAKIRHDLSEQFMVIQELMHRNNHEKAAEMLHNLSEYVASTKEYDYCGDPVVNAILAENEKLCTEKEIRFVYELDITRPLKIDPVAICSIFTNLMRNAIVAADKAEDRKDAYISIKAVVKGDYLHIKVDNFCKREDKKEKRDRKGYGLEILNTLAEKYNGQVDIICQEGKYSTRISVENVSKSTI